mgnify:CR=1 FL=1
MATILILDYGQGNHHSIAKHLTRLGAEYRIDSSLEAISKADKIILPGVGHFGQAMQNLRDLNIIEALNKRVLIDKVPVLGICLGMQLMCSYSEEGNVKGLNWINADVKRFAIKDKSIFKVPHTGWNKVVCPDQKWIKITDNEFYFVHNYYVDCKDKMSIYGTTPYENDFTSMFVKDNIIGCQFHPEKSHDAGFYLLQQFVNL